jgi:predicted CopG family antitoxin
MAVKTITIDLEAYEALRRQKRRGQSFSQVIKEHFNAPRTGRDLQAALERFALSSDTLDAIDDVVRNRTESPAEPVEL